jgi:translation initiation factor IF-2
MPEEKTIRIAAASREFNVGVQHIAEFLKEKGFEVDAKPTTKLSQEMYTMLIKEYSKDKVLKEKADQVNIGVARQIDKEEEAERVEAAKVEAEKLALAKTEETPEIEEVPEQKAKEPEVKPVEEEKVVEPEAEKEVIKARKEEAKSLTVVGKIEIAEKKPKKAKVSDKKAPAKKTAEKKKEADPVKELPVEEEKVVEEKVPEIKVEKVPEESRMIETKRVKLEGPKIMGKIEIKPPVEREKKKTESEADKKKRKRIRKPERINVDRNRDNQSNTNRRGTDNRTTKAPLDPEEQQRLIQEQIRTTLAKLGAGKGRSNKSKFRKQKRETHREEEEGRQVDSEFLNVAEFTSLSELASLMNIPATELVQKCFDLGTMVSINQRLDAEIIELLAEEFGFKVKFINATEDDDEEEEIEEDPATLEDRPPIVTIMGHVDHGKTSLLDYIRESNVVAGEKGGITQHIGAYEVVTETGRRIAFLDTPGHEAFTAMRARGAKLTDIAIIVIAADDLVMPQTKEAISHSQAAGVPMVFAINKIDRETANPERIKEQLSQMNILVEDWGGKFQSQEISAKNGLNVEVLLEKVLLEADLLELKANPNKDAIGTTIEASLDKGRGYVCNVMVQEGTMKVGDMVVAGPYYGRVKAMFNERNQKIKEAGPSTPLLLLGLNGAPQAGERFKVYQDEDEAKTVANRRMQIVREQGIRTKKHITLEEIGRRKALGTFRELNIIIKADVDGSAEALTDSLMKLTTEEVQVNVIFKGVGQITETDIMLASASDAVIVGFQVRPSSVVRALAEKEGVEIRLYSIIYKAIEEVKDAMEGLLAPKVEEKVTCTVEIRETFKISKVGTIAGCNVQEGKITRNTQIRIIRDGIVLHTGTLASLKRYKDDVKEVTSGMDCGLNINNYNDIEVGDIIEGFEEVEVKRKL